MASSNNISSQDAARLRESSVRVRRLTISPPSSPPPPAGETPLSALNSSGVATTDARPGSPSAVQGRKRAITISDRLHNEFERENTPQSAARLGRAGSIGSRRARATSVGSVDALEPSVIVAGSPPQSPRTRRGSQAVPPSEALADVQEEEHHAQDQVDLLDVIDPQVATATYWSNVSSAIAVPPLPFLNRAPVVDIKTSPLVEHPSTALSTDDFDKHVEALLSVTKKEKAKKALKGLWAFMKTPVGIFFTIYGILVVFWGAALVLILITAIPMPSELTRKYWIEICSQILNGLFTITGVGLIPWRVIDTYRIGWIWTYANRVWRRRKHRGLDRLANNYDLPQHVPAASSTSAPAAGSEEDKGSDVSGPAVEVQHKVDQRVLTDSSKIEPASVGQLELGHKKGLDPITMLTPKEEEDLLVQQLKFQKSQTWYRPHETATHYAFPLHWALWIAVLFDGNSIFQCCLCASMWGYANNYLNRPAWQTALGIVLSFLCGIAAAVLIWQGGKRTKKVTAVDEAVRAILKERKERKKAEHHPHSFTLPHAIPHFGHKQSGGARQTQQGAASSTELLK